MVKLMELGYEVGLIYIKNEEGNYLMYFRENYGQEEIPENKKWGLIGGVIEQGESNYDGLVREIKEEINSPITNIKFIGKYLKNTGQNISFYVGETDYTLEKIVMLERPETKIKFFNRNEILENKDIFTTETYDYFKLNMDKL